MVGGQGVGRGLGRRPLAQGHPGQEDRRVDGTSRKDVPAPGRMRDSKPLRSPCELHSVLADDVTGTDDAPADPAQDSAT